MPDYFTDQAAMLRRLVEQHLDPDRSATADHLAELDRWHQELRKADEDEDCERFDGLS